MRRRINQRRSDLAFKGMAVPSTGRSAEHRLWRVNPCSIDVFQRPTNVVSFGSWRHSRSGGQEGAEWD